MVNRDESEEEDGKEEEGVLNEEMKKGRKCLEGERGGEADS